MKVRWAGGLKRDVPDRAVKGEELVTGAKHVELMIAYRLGVQEKQKFSAVEVDEDYFE